MEISIRQTSIKPAHIKILLTNGIFLVSHLTKLNAQRLFDRTRQSAKPGTWTLEDCEQVLNAIKPKRPFYTTKLSDFMIYPPERISTLIPGIDSILGGGIRAGQLTEISGEAGAGKSNLCAQIGTLVMLPKEDNGWGGDVLLIHTEGEGKLKLAIKRFKTLESSLDKRPLVDTKLHVMNCGSEFELLEIVSRLPGVLDQKPTVRLIIVDSVTCAFIPVDSKPDMGFYAKRSRMLTKFAKLLADIAWERRLLVLITNHVSYNFKYRENRPALGPMWSHMCQTKIYLERKDTGYEVERFAKVTKGALSTPSTVRFTISNL